MARELSVKIVGDPSSFLRAADRVERRSDSMSKKLGRTAKRLGKAGLIAGGALTAGAAVGLKKSVDAASDLDEAINKSAQTFEDSAPVIEAWAKDAATNLGLSSQAALEGAASIGAMLKPMGVAPDRAAEMSKTMAVLAADMASFNNEDPTEMLNRIRAGLSGESEPLKRFGAVLSETRVKAFAMANGFELVDGKLTESQKIQARYGLLLEDTADQQGDFARTSDGLANKQRILSARMQDVAAKVGQAFLPAAEAATAFVADTMIPKLGEFGGLVADKVGPVMAELGPKIEEGFASVMSALAPAFDFIRETVAELWPKLRKQMERTFKAIASNAKILWDALQPVFRAIGRVLKNVVIPIFMELREMVTTVIEKIAGVLRDKEPQIKRIFRAIARVVDFLGEAIMFLWANVVKPILKPMFTTIIPKAIGFAIDAVDGIIGAIEWLKDKAALWGANIQSTVRRIFQFGKDSVAKVIDFARDSWNALTGAIESLKDKIGGWMTTVKDKISGAFDKAAEAVSGFWEPFGKVIDGFRWLVKQGGEVYNILKKIWELGPGKLGGQGIDSARDALQATVARAMPAQTIGQNQWEPSLQHALSVGTALGLKPTTYAGHLPRLTGAIDWFGDSATLSRFAQWAMGKPGIEQLIYTPWGIWTHPRRSEGRRPVTGMSGENPPRPLADTHWDHLHMGTFDSGGFLQPGVTLAMNNTGRPERVLPPGAAAGIVVNVNVAGSVQTERDLATAVRDEIVRLQRRNGTSGIV